MKDPSGRRFGVFKSLDLVAGDLDLTWYERSLTVYNRGPRSEKIINNPCISKP